MSAAVINRGPTADEVAVAIVTACRILREDPIRVARGQDKPPFRSSRARHYALQALNSCFPRIRGRDLARYCGVREKADQYWKTSCYLFVKPAPTRKRPVWWTETGFGDVVSAIQAEMTRANVALHRPQSPTKLSALSGYTGLGVEVLPGKRDLRDMLAEAVRNTAKLQEAKRAEESDAEKD